MKPLLIARKDPVERHRQTRQLLVLVRFTVDRRVQRLDGFGHQIIIRLGKKNVRKRDREGYRSLPMKVTRQIGPPHVPIAMRLTRMRRELGQLL